MKHIIQGDKRNCGQIAVAILTNRSLEEVEKVVGHTHSTRTKELAKALGYFGYSALNRRKAVKTFPTGKWFGIVHTRFKTRQRGGHWVAVAKGKVYDGCVSRAMSIEEYTQMLDETGWKITAALPVW